MAHVILDQLSDVELLQRIMQRISQLEVHTDKDTILVFLTIQLVKRLEETGFYYETDKDSPNSFDGLLKSDRFVFKKGTTKLEIDQWIAEFLNMSFDGILSLIGFVEFSNLPEEDSELPMIDASHNLILGIDFDCADEDELSIYDMFSGTQPQCPYTGEFYTGGYIANTQLDVKVELSSAMLADDCVVSLVSDFDVEDIFKTQLNPRMHSTLSVIPVKDVKVIPDKPQITQALLAAFRIIVDGEVCVLRGLSIDHSEVVLVGKNGEIKLPMTEIEESDSIQFLALTDIVTSLL